MELDITHLADTDTVDLMDYSASAAELGQDAGRVTWQNAMESAKENPLLKTRESRIEAQSYLKEFGAWTIEEIRGWTNTEINALILQFIAGDLREYLKAESDPDTFESWQENYGGSIYRGDNGRLYYYLGM